MTKEPIDFFKEFEAAAADSAALSYRESIKKISVCCESPIEEVFIAACVYRLSHAGHSSLAPIWFFENGGLCYEDATKAKAGDGLYVRPQVVIGNHRVDFLFYYLNYETSYAFAVECDGHAFHERTKEQAERDRSRDRGLMLSGITPVRFTGSEIWRDPIRCVETVVALIEKAAGYTD